MPGLRIYICGRMAIESHGHRILEREFPARQGRLLWAYLVIQRQRPVGKLELADALWGDEIPDGWDNTLNAIASRLRSMLRPLRDHWPDLTIVVDSGRYQLSLPAGAFVDRERARAGLHMAESALTAGDFETARGEARVAMEIAARGFMDGETAPWIEGQRRSLLDIRVHAWECTIDAELRRGNHQRAEREAEDLLGLDPLNEKAYRIQMLASIALGNRAGAVRAMERCRESLRLLADIEPSTETLRAYQQATTLH